MRAYFLLAFVGWSLALSALAAAPPAVNAITPAQAHYIVFEDDGTGAPRPVFHRLIPATGIPPSLADSVAQSRLQNPPDRDHRRREVVVEDALGRVTYRAVVTVSETLRGEFHAAGGGIDGHRIARATTHFVARVPAIAGGRLAISLPGGAARFDLDAIGAQAGSGTGADAVPAPVGLTGDPANRVDLLVMGDGYTAAQASTFASDVAALENAFFAISPLSAYRNFFNVTSLFTPSAQSGADHPPYVAGCSAVSLSCCGDPEMSTDPLRNTFRSTAFHARYCTSNIHRLLTVSEAAVFQAASAVPEWDAILVIVNDDTYGGAGGQIGVFSTHGAAVQIAQHEFGHSFVHLADEYEDVTPGYPACSDVNATIPPCEANVTDQTVRALIKWLPWIQAATPIPTPEGFPQYENTVGLFPGARYRATGMYRPGDSCIMRALGAPFCPIASQEVVLTLYRGGWGTPQAGIDLIEPGSESPPPGIVGEVTGATTFSADVLSPQGGPPAAVSWYVNGVRVSGRTDPSFTFTPTPGAYAEVELRVTDATSLVHPSMSEGELESSRLWMLGPGIPANIALTASPALLHCNGIEEATVVATVTDVNGENVPDGRPVVFSVSGAGTAIPTNAVTVDGIAQTLVTPDPGPAFVTVVARSGPAETSIRIDCRSPDSSRYPIPIGVPPYNGLLNTTGFTLEVDEARPCGGVIGATAWYLISVPPEVSYLRVGVYTVGSNFDTMLAVYRVTASTPLPPAAALLVSCNNNFNQTAQSLTEFNAYGGELFYVQAGGYNGATGQLILGASCGGLDTDCDGSANAIDRCPLIFDPVQTDTDADGAGDACDLDDDSDGCSDAHELGSSPVFGGDRNPLDRWDFFDVDGAPGIDLGDALAVLGLFGATPGDAGYDLDFDRYAPDGARPWRTAAAAGPHVGIDLQDALYNLLSFGHSCSGPVPA